MAQRKYFKTLNAQAQIKHVSQVDRYLNKRLSSAATGACKVFYRKLIDANNRRKGGPEKNTPAEEHGDEVLGIFSFD